MAYCTIDDIEKQLSSATLIQLTSDNEQEDVNRTIVEEAIIYSSALIDGYLRGRYTLPLDTRFPLLRILAIDISIYRLYSRRVWDNIPDAIENAYNNAISTLRDIQKGIISLQSENDLLETSGFNPQEYKTNKELLDRIFNRKKMREY